MRPLSILRKLRQLARLAWRTRATAGLAAMLALAATWSPQLRAAIGNTWQLAARDAQLRPDDCAQIWLLQWGRGSGKTRAATEHTLDVMEEWGPAFAGCLVSKTYGDVLTTMINDPMSGLIACARRRGYELRHVAGQSKEGGPFLQHPNGALLYYRSAEKVGFGRGLNLNYFWLDEIADWPHGALPGLIAFIGAWRIPAPDGGKPLGVITTTPQTNAVMRWLRAHERKHLITITRQRSSDNPHIDSSTLESTYVGTTLYKQEVDGEMLDEGSGIEPREIDAWRVETAPPLDRMRRIVIVDPAGESHAKADAVGIVGLGADATTAHPTCYVLGDRTSGGMEPREWARAAVDYAIEIGACKILVEKNYGGEMAPTQIRIAIEEVEREFGTTLDIVVEGLYVHHDKRTRATGPIALTQQGRVRFVGHHEALEKEICEYVPGEPSPNRMDAWAMGVVDLLLPKDRPVFSVATLYG